MKAPPFRPAAGVRARLPRLAAFAVLLVVAAMSSAQEPGLSFKGMAGTLGNYIGKGEWAQIVVRIVNASEESQVGTITCAAPTPHGAKAYFSRVVSLPARSQRQVRLAVRLPADEEEPEPPAGSRRPRPAAKARKGKKAAEANQPDTDETAEQRIVKILPETELPVVLSSSAGQVRQAYLAQTLTPNMVPLAVLHGRGREAKDTDSYITKRASLMNVQRLAGATIDRLPDHWLGYGGAAVVVLGASGAVNVTGPQLEALLDWVQRGGVLVLAGGHSMPEALRGPLGRAAGCTAVGVHRISSLEARPLADPGTPGSTPSRLNLQWPLPMVELLPLSAEVTWEANGLPLLTHRTYGRGHLFTLAVPTGALFNPDDERNSLHRIWESIVPTGVVHVPAVNEARFMEAAQGEDFAPAHEAIRGIAGRRGPPLRVPVVIIAALVALTIVCGVVFRLRRRGELVWVVLLPAAVLAAVALYGYGRSQIAPEQLTGLGLITPLAEGDVRVQEVFAYYSGEDTRDLSFSAGSPRAVIRPFQLGEAVTGRDEIRTGSALSLHDKTVRTGSGCGFFVDGVAQVEVISGRLTFDENGLAGTLRNHLPADIDSAVIYANRRTYRLGGRGADDEPGRIPAGGEKLVRVGPEQLLGAIKVIEPASNQPVQVTVPANGKARGPQPQPQRRRPQPAWVKGEFTGKPVLTDTDLLRNKLVGRLVGLSTFRGRASREPVLIGYAAHSPMDPLPGRDVRRQGWTIVIWPLQIGPPPAADRDRPVTIPEGFVDVAFRQRGVPVWNIMTETFQPGRHNAELIVQAAPPASFGGLREASAVLRISIRAPRYRLEVGGYKGGDPDGERVVLKPFDNPRLSNEAVAIDRADRFRQADGTYVFSLKVERLDRPSEARMDPTDIVEWAFESVDVSLKGRPQ